MKSYHEWTEYKKQGDKERLFSAELKKRGFLVCPGKALPFFSKRGFAMVSFLCENKIQFLDSSLIEPSAPGREERNDQPVQPQATPFS
jgi:hypothetical protein